MKKGKLFVFALVSLIMMGCSNDDVIEGGGDGGTEQDNREAWFALNLKTVTGATRALNGTDKDPSEAPNETEIPTAKVIFFKYTGTTSPVPLAQKEPDKFLVVDAIDLNTSEIGTPGLGTSGSAGNAFKVSKEIEYLLFVGNPPASFPAIVKNVSTFTDVNRAIKISSIADVATSGKFMMTNAKGDLEPSIDQASGANPTLAKIETYSDATTANGKPTSITIDRVVAKVRVYTATDLAAKSKMNFQDLGWVLNVTNNYFFPTSERIKTNLEAASGFSKWVWSDTYHIGSYRRDPNYSDNLTIWPSSSTTPTAEYAEQYSYFHSGSTIDDSAWKIPAVAGGTTPAVYCLENTQSADGNMHAFTTQVLLKGVVNPATYQIPNSATPQTAESTAHDWLDIGNGYYTPGTLKLWIAAQLNAGESTLATAFNEYLTEIAKDVSSGVSSVNINMSDVPATILAFNTQIDAVGSYEKRAGTYGSVKYYAEGESYYKIMIKHDNDNDKSNNALGEFGVVRNAVYDISVTAINNPGYPIIPDPDPTIPNEIEEAWLSIEINVNDWTWYSQEEEL